MENTRFFSFPHGNQIDLDQLLVVALSTNRTDTFNRLIRSLDIYRYRYEVDSIVSSVFSFVSEKRSVQ